MAVEPVMRQTLALLPIRFLPGSRIPGKMTVEQATTSGQWQNSLRSLHPSKGLVLLLAIRFPTATLF